MKNLAYYFIGVAALFALVGMVFGVYMAATANFTLAPAHAHNNLLGWVSMAIFGLYYSRVPSVANTRIALVHFWVALVGNIIFPIGIAMTLLGQSEVVVSIGSLLEILSMLIFAYVVWTHRQELAA
ncbi:MAG: hypothetical protein ABI377_05865 [Devosia sp.]